MLQHKHGCHHHKGPALKESWDSDPLSLLYALAVW